jgi:glyoxylase-like metal-dependent hydrolase (beta-lactamase superfamily II)
MKKALIILALVLLIAFVGCSRPSINTKEIIANDLNIKIFDFNVNTLVCYDKTKNGVIVDPGMSSEWEQKILLDFITKEKIVVKYIINTHPHSDHISGNAFCVQKFKTPLVAHEAGLPLYNNVATNDNIPNYPKYDILISEGDNLIFGNQIWKTIYTPGHADGSICFYDKKNKLVIVGDVLFAGAIGRTDLPTGDFHQLIKNIDEKLLPLGDDVLVIPGHGETTTIGNEKKQLEPLFEI